MCKSSVFNWNVLAICISLLFLHACATPPQTKTAPPLQLLSHQAFQPSGAALETPAQIFFLPAAVIQDVRNQVLRYDRAYDQQLALLRYIFHDENRDILEYVNDATLTATETLQLRVANCLSLTILAASLAEAVGFHVDFQDVAVPEYWISRSGSSMLNGHVNIKLTPSLLTLNSQGLFYQPESYLIDFDRGSGQIHQRAKSVSRQTVIAMFYNNKAADAMLLQQYDLAFEYLQAALSLIPAQAEIWNNLAVLYRKKELLAEAEQSYQYSLQLDPNNNNTLANLAMLYEKTGRVEQAKELNQKVVSRRLKNPYYFVMLGNEALDLGMQQQALSEFGKALKLQPKTTEAHFGMAQGYLALGNYQQAKKHLRSAGEYTEDKILQRRYQTKLGLLHAIARQTK